jgi:hypothetical protein
LAELLQSPFLGTVLSKEVVQMLAEHPEQREQIIGGYKAAFGYEFFDILAATSMKIRKTTAADA